MPGRQAHGRPLTTQPKAKSNNRKGSKARSQKNALNAFGIAQEKFPARQKKTPRFRELDAEIERKHGREDEDEEDDEEEEQPQRKKARGPSRPADDDAEYGSDSEGNEWRLGGLAEDDEDSEIESDNAFGDSDDEKFDGYSFRGSKSQPKDDEDSEDDENDDEGETLGEDAIDLATALDQWEEESEEEAKDDSRSSSDSDSDGSSGSDEDSGEEGSDESSEDEVDEADPEKLEALRGLVSGFGGEEDDNGKAKGPTKQKIGLGDLGLTGLDDPFMKNSVKLMNKEDKEKRPGATKKLDIPLAKRQQDRMDRSAAYEKTNETLDRWTETVKHNRRAEHLVFPLPQTTGNAGLDTTEIQPLSGKTATNELESTILSIMDQSGLSMDKPKKPKEEVYDEEGNALTRKEILKKKRLERELNSREAKRAARIKKIKSKAYHRVHRKQQERDDMAAKREMEENGEIDSEEEREAQDRRRALERVGQRHKESKWAKMGSKAKRAVWDEDFRAGLTEMARQDEELRRRKEGRRVASDDSDETSSSGSDSEDGGDASLRRQLAALEEEDAAPESGLMSMKFMQKAEAARKKENDELIQQIRKDLGQEQEGDEDEDEGREVGRRQYGGAGPALVPALDTSTRASKNRDADAESSLFASATSMNASGPSGISKAPSKRSGATNGNSGAWSSKTVSQLPEATNGKLNAWSQGGAKPKKKGSSSAKVAELDFPDTALIAPRSSKSKTNSNKSAKQGRNGHVDADSDSEADQHLPLAIRDQELVARAFASEDVVGDFEREKEEMAEAEDDKVVDNTLPGWGSWVGEGVSNREKKRHQGRFMTKVEGIKKKDRKDAKLDKVIINEKRIKKNDRYLSSQLPHPFESREQYERSLRLPVGPEWQTKETFQDSTKPRVLMKQGIIAPMSKPTI